MSALPSRVEASDEGARATAYLVLSGSAVSWSANAVAARLAVGEISPMVMISLRWCIVALLVAAIWRHEIAAAMPVLRRHWRLAAVLGTFGLTGFNALFYVAAHMTTAANLSILQGSIPVFVLIGAFFAYRTRVRAMQAAGVALTLIGVVIVAAKGDFHSLHSLTFNVGDLMMVTGCACYAMYTVALHIRPKLPAIVFFAQIAGAAFLSSLPLLAIEASIGALQWPTPKGWAILAFVAVFPTFLAQLWFMRGVELIGPARAGIFANLVPILGPLLAILVLGEPFAGHQALALVLVLGGIFLAEPRRRPLVVADGGT